MATANLNKWPPEGFGWSDAHGLYLIDYPRCKPTVTSEFVEALKAWSDGDVGPIHSLVKEMERLKCDAAMHEVEREKLMQWLVTVIQGSDDPERWLAYFDPDNETATQPHTHEPEAGEKDAQTD